MPKIVTRKEAQKLGLRTYFTGKACKHGHITGRRTDTSNCLECLKIYRINNSRGYTKLSKEERSELWKRNNRRFREKNREGWLKLKNEWREKNKHKVLAHRAVEWAVKKGVLIKKICEICGEKETVGHHDDYNQQLVVRWLCQYHHLEWHKTNQAIEVYDYGKGKKTNS